MSWECTVCQESNTNIPLRVLNCNHILHDKCISEWCKHSRTCPLCRKAVLGTGRSYYSFISNYFPRIDYDLAVDFARYYPSLISPLPLLTKRKYADKAINYSNESRKLLTNFPETCSVCDKSLKHKTILNHYYFNGWGSVSGL